MQPRPPLPRHRERGALLIVALILCAVIGVSLASYLRLAGATLKGANRSALAFAGVNVVEMGVERAMACFAAVSAGTATMTAWSGWTLATVTSEATATFPSASTYFTVGPNVRAQAKVLVRYYTGSEGTPQIVAQAVVTPPDGPVLTKTVEVTLANRSLWALGLVGRTWVRMNSNAKADSWISDTDGNPATVGTAYAASLRRDNGSVGTVSAAVGALALDSNAEIYGTANTGGAAVTTSSTVRIYGATSPATPKVDASRVHTDFTFTFPAITLPIGTPVNLVTATLTGGTAGSPQVLPRASDVASADGRYYLEFASGKSINLDSNRHLAITQPVVLIFASHSGADSIHANSNANIVVAAGKAVEVYTNGNIRLDSNNTINAGNDARNFRIYGTNPATQTFTLSSNVLLTAAIYAPNATYRMDSNCVLSGAVIANTIQVDSNAEFHYDESLAGAATGGGLRVTKWRELQSAAERASYAAGLGF